MGVVSRKQVAQMTRLAKSTFPITIWHFFSSLWFFRVATLFSESSVDCARRDSVLLLCDRARPTQDPSLQRYLASQRLLDRAADARGVAVQCSSRILGVRPGLQVWQRGGDVRKRDADTKRSRSRRPIKLQNWIVVVLCELHRAALRGQGTTNPCPEATDLVFKTVSGRPIKSDRLAKSFKSILERAGLPRIRLYDLRHTAATLALAAGVSPKVVARPTRDHEAGRR